jgi:cell shape-determining protein MreD
MLFKKEFKSDRPYSGFWGKLHLTHKQRKGVLKWSMYGLLLLVLSLLQDVVFCRMRLFGATTELVPVAIFLICILEGAESGSVFSLVASLLYLFSGSAAGTYSMLFITVLAVCVTVFRQAYLQKGFGAALICVIAAMLCYEFLQFAIGLFLELTIPSRWIGFLTTALLSCLAVPVLYPIALSIGKIGGETWKE